MLLYIFLKNRTNIIVQLLRIIDIIIVISKIHTYYKCQKLFFNHNIYKIKLPKKDIIHGRVVKQSLILKEQLLNEKLIK